MDENGNLYSAKSVYMQKGKTPGTLNKYSEVEIIVNPNPLGVFTENVPESSKIPHCAVS